jgi:hypothetical protein
VSNRAIFDADVHEQAPENYLCNYKGYYNYLSITEILVREQFTLQAYHSTNGTQTWEQKEQIGLLDALSDEVLHQYAIERVTSDYLLCQYQAVLFSQWDNWHEHMVWLITANSPEIAYWAANQK